MQTDSASERIDFHDVYTSETDKVSSDYLSEFASLIQLNHYKVAVIESMTGGGIARKLVSLPGCSDYFLGGVVAYHSRLKVQHGLVNPKTIVEHGVVSARVTEEMAAGIKKSTQADITIASNGIAGPANDTYSIDQSGTVFLSWNIRDKIIKTKRYKIEGDRNNIIDKAVFIALSMCLRYIKNDLRKDQ